MIYKELKNYYYKDNTLEQYNKEYNTRFNSVSTIKFPIKIAENQSFCVVTSEILGLIEKIYKLNNSIDELLYSLPGVAIKQYINQLLVDEIKSTNEIEGIHSTRKEILLTLKNQNKKNSLQGIITKYLLLIEKRDINIESLSDFKSLYTQMILPEINEIEDLPDGEFFRKKEVYVQDYSGKKIHTGIIPENQINANMMQIIEFMSNDNKESLFIKTAIVQYFIGYTHPYYDGNGRLSRFLGSYILSKAPFKNILSTISLSNAIMKNRKKYYKAFDMCNDKKNKGDITPFIIFILEILCSESNQIIVDLTKKQELLKRQEKNLDLLLNNKGLNKKKYEGIFELMYTFIQNALFHPKELLDVKTIANALNLSKGTVRARLEHAINLGFNIEIKINGTTALYKYNLPKQ